MTTLTIKDLHIAADLDSRAMSAVRGGTGWGFPMIDVSKFSLSNSAQQLASQEQNTLANTGVNAAFAQKIHADVDPTQKARNTNTINLGGYGYAPL
jgi:hypothetical protein